MGENLFLDQPNEIVALFIEYAKCNSELRLVNENIKDIYDNFANQKCKVMEIYSDRNIPVLPPNWLFAVRNFIPEKLLNLTYSISLRGTERGNEYNILSRLSDLKTCDNLKVLDFSFNHFIEGGLSGITYLLQHNSKLTSLNLASNGINNQRLHELLTPIQNKLNLSSINLSDNEISNITPLIFKISTNTKPISLNLCRNRLNLEGISLFMRTLKNSNLTSLNLRENPITHEGMNEIVHLIENNPKLTSLNLRETNIGDDGINVLASIPSSNIKYLNLGCNQIGDIGIYHFAENHYYHDSLISLNLRSNRIGPYGMKALFRGIREIPSLTSINIRNNKFGQFTDVIETIASVLKFSSNITTLNIGYNNIGSIGVRILVNSIQNLKILKLKYNEIDSDDAFFIALNLNNSNLTTLDLSHNKIDSNGVKYLAEAIWTNTKLTSLDLSWNDINDVGLWSLIDVLKYNSTLNILKLESIGIIYSVKSLMPVLHKLKVLDLSINHIGDSGANTIAEALKSNTSLETLKLSYNKIFDTGAKSLAAALLQNSTLLHLDLSYNEITFLGAQTLVNVLQATVDLEPFISWYDRIKTNIFRKPIVLTPNSSLRTLNLRSNSIEDGEEENLWKNFTPTQVKVNYYGRFDE